MTQYGQTAKLYRPSDHAPQEYCALGAIYHIVVNENTQPLTRRQRLRNRLDHLREDVALWICPWLDGDDLS